MVIQVDFRSPDLRLTQRVESADEACELIQNWFEEPAVSEWSYHDRYKHCRPFAAADIRSNNGVGSIIVTIGQV